VEIEGKDAYQAVDYMICEGQFTETCSFRGVILTDYPEDDFRMDIDGVTSDFEQKIPQLKITIWILSIKTFYSRKKPNDSLQIQTLISVDFQNLPILN
jgi:hypothetical protein